ncbi:regulator of V-ATPase in vacuolar membrane protein 1 [Trichoderma asperellum]|uniref:Regulator of V-ATPase in vacuolar membrane protein 1 n=1 Tax=Trichoderma asperellum TaxID=101201 RepID=A0A6V8R648_TRIAP|nr:regulator of V-ATPase in vacuolar membrane protein 1 [Trichoderma asperellum]
MSVVLPGKPQSRLQGLAIGYWNNLHLNAYITGNAFTILDGLQTILQTIYDENDEPLEAIAIDELTGKIATSTATQVRVYKPLGGLQEDALKWALQLTFDIPRDDSETACALSWGSSEELLVAGNYLSLFCTGEHSGRSWEQLLPSPAKIAALSYDSAYIASVGYHDYLAKVWRRLTYGSDDVRFDMAYLPHPDVVTNIRWRKPFHVEQATGNVLYTSCLDGYVRVWIPTDTLQGWQWHLWGKIDITESIPNDLSQQEPWLACIIDGRDFTASVERAIEQRMADDSSTDDVALDHLVAIANRSPEICLAMNRSGFLTAWALENVGSTSTDDRQIFNIAQTISPGLENLSSLLHPDDISHVQIETYCNRKTGQLRILLHIFDGRIAIFECSAADLFDPTANDKRLLLHSVWSGHSASIKKIVRNFSGRAVVSRTSHGETIVWEHSPTNPVGSSHGALDFSRRSIIPETGHIHRICVLRKGRFVVFLRKTVISLWDCRREKGISLAQSTYEAPGDPLCLIILPKPQDADYRTAHIAMITSKGRGIVWELSLPNYAKDSATTLDVGIKEFSQVNLKSADDLKYVLPVDPAGSGPISSGFLDIFARDIAMSSVGFQYRVLLLSQMRFDYLNKGAAWIPIREISIRELTPHPIGDSTWLDNGYLLIGAGNQLFVHDRRVTAEESLTTDLRLPHLQDGTWDLFEAVQRFNGPLPVFHPQFLSQCILAGRNELVRRILVELHKTLKFLVPGESVDNYLGIELEEFYQPTSENANRAFHTGFDFSDKAVNGEDTEVFTEEIATSINEKLTRLGVPQLSGHEQIQLVDMIECVALVERERRSIDENGARFMLFFRQHALRKGRTNEIQLSWREINWAYHSESQDILADFVSRQNHNVMLWEHARESGIFMWLTDTQHLQRQFEAVARNEYTKDGNRNPVNCSLFYIALRKKAVLQGLWRMAGGDKEQITTQRFLAHDFEEARWRTAALKNAYALLSKRRFKYAAAFFLLADRLEDAVEVCLRQLKDLQLAIAITRVYEGNDGPVLRKVLQEEVLTVASHEGNRWLASWAFWMLGRKDMAVRALATPIYTLLETPSSPDLKSRSFLADDPALVVLYSQLRQQTLQTLRGASKVSPKVEWEFVLHSAKLYDRMGCDLLGLSLGTHS